MIKIIISSLFVILLVQGTLSNIVDENIKKCEKEIFDGFHQAMIAQSQMPHQEKLKCPGSELKSNPLTKKIGRQSSVLKCALQKTLEGGEMPREEIITSLKSRQILECSPVQNVTCLPSFRFRRINGECNNLVHTTWGSANIPMRRRIPPAYEDGFDEPRGGGVNAPETLPNPRTISTTIHNDIHVEANGISNMVPQWGQFLDHDITLTPEDGGACCATPSIDPNCWGINIPDSDGFYPEGHCLDYTRSVSWCFPLPDGEHREQMNAITAFIDGSHIYGSDEERQAILRSPDHGTLISNGKYDDLLPYEEDAPGTGIFGPFKAGDNRVNEMPGLAVMHSVFHREHNRLAISMRDKMPSWNNNRIYDEARRIIGALIQVITYREFLPVVMGSTGMDAYNLTLTPTSTYDPEVDPSIENQFATASYRFGHTLVSGKVDLLGFEQSHINSYEVRDNYFNGDMIIQDKAHGYRWILGGLTLRDAQAFDSHFSEDLTNYLFKAPTAEFGSDLAARNIQRGRDHGIPSYNAFRVECGLSPLTIWANRPSEIPASSWTSLESVYTNPEDIDLYTGQLVESPLAGTVTGPTLNCLLGPQFQKLKFGDRFFVTHENQAGSFTPQQIQELMNYSLSDILCQNSDMDEVQEDVFHEASASNPMLSCSLPSREFNLGIFLL